MSPVRILAAAMVAAAPRETTRAGVPIGEQQQTEHGGAREGSWRASTRSSAPPPPSSPCGIVPAERQVACCRATYARTGPDVAAETAPPALALLTGHAPCRLRSRHRADGETMNVRLPPRCDHASTGRCGHRVLPCLPIDQGKDSDRQGDRD
eukprot:scaffold9517_cov117-Isochrysis_galbana.AAC.6